METTRRARLEARLATKEAQLEALEATYTEMSAWSVKEYELDTAGDVQRVRRISLKELREQIKTLETEIDNLYSKLNGGGVIKLRSYRY